MTIAAPSTKWPAYFNERIETMGPDELRALQNERFVRQFRYVRERSAFYRRKLTGLGIEAGGVRSIDDLAKLPFTEKSELRDALLEQPPTLGSNQIVPIEEIVRIHASSGTTGRPTYVGLTKQDNEEWIESCARTFWATGIRPDDIVVHGWNYSLFVGGIADHLGCEATGATMVPVGVGQSVRLVRVSRDLRATAVTSTPSYSFYLTEIVRKELGIEPHELGLKRIVVGGEPGGGIPATRQRLEEIWQADVREAYGMVDIHPIIGAECEVKEGMHMLVADLVYPELIDPDTGRVLEIQAGAEGEIVYTAIQRQANALLRFRTHDIIHVYHAGRCACGRTSYRFKVVGRSDDMLIVKGVNVYPSAIEDVLRGIKGLTGNFAVLLDQPGPYDHLDIAVEPDEGTGQADLAGLKALAEERIGSILLFQARLSLVPPQSLPRFELKAKRVYKLYAGEPSPVKISS